MYNEKFEEKVSSKETELSYIDNRLSKLIEALGMNFENIGDRLNYLAPIQEVSKSEAQVKESPSGLIGHFRTHINNLERLVEVSDIFKSHLNKLV